jgi:thioredoxin reductase (NADPH)
MPEHNLHEVAFPRLDEAQLAALERFGTRKTFGDGRALFAAGERGFKFFVVLSGRVEIVDRSGDKPRTVTVHEPREFTGDVDLMTGRPAVVSGVARGPCEALAVGPDDVRRLVAERPDLGDLLLHAFIARRQLLEESGFVGCRVIGSRYSRDTFRVRDFLAKNRVPYTWVDAEADPGAEALLRHFHVTAADTPVVACGHKLLLKHPSNRELAEKLGIRQPVDAELYDLLVVGAGPAGLAAAVYGASEGLNTVVVDALAPGGQAGCSSKIENYLGFPTGLSGAELAGNATLQAEKFGAKFSVPSCAVGMDLDGPYQCVRLEGGECAAARCVLVATGAEYRRLDVPGRERFEGLGVYYAATWVEAKFCQDSTVVVVGGGNSAGQAAVFLAERAARKMLLVVRADDLAKDMSRYLARRVETTENIELLLGTAVKRLAGDGCLRAVELVNRHTGQARTVEAPALFSFIGAAPRTDWLPEAVAKDAKGFVLTGPAAARSGRWPLPRPPLLLETSRPGVFAAGDVRAGSSKRVAAAVGEGSMAVQLVHQFLNGDRT